MANGGTWPVRLTYSLPQLVYRHHLLFHFDNWLIGHNAQEMGPALFRHNWAISEDITKRLFM